MTYHDAFGAVLLTTLGGMFLCWHSWCWFTMLFRCQRPKDFFSRTYSTSGPFLAVNFVFVLLAGAGLLWWVTQ